jgi:hypothetical protein
MLNIDILHLIFEELNNKNYSLFSCLMVNKQWCELVVPILWNDPLAYIIINSPCFIENYYQKIRLLFYIILLHLPKTLRNFYGVNNIIYSIKNIKNLTFNYISFCKRLINFKLILPQIYENLVISKRESLEIEVYKLFISECSSIRFLSITYMKHPIYQYPGANISLSNLYELFCCSSNNPELFYGFVDQ